MAERVPWAPRVHQPQLEASTSTLGRVENSKTFQNQMAQCFFIGLYDIETGDDFYFFQNFFLMGGNGF